MSSLTLDSLSKSFHNVIALDNVSLQIGAGAFVALLGPSGSGKTTLLRLLAGFEQPSRGQIRIADQEVSQLPPGSRNIGMVFQHYALFPHLSVEQNIEYGLRMRHWSASRRRARVEELLAMVRLTGFGKRLPRQLSGGQQQRVAIARALAYSPSILLMDEPLGALDRNLRLEMAEEIRRIHRELRVTFIFVTHDREEAMALADRLIIMHNGTIAADGQPEDLYHRPNSEFVARFYSGMNVIDGASLPIARPGRFGVASGAICFDVPDAPHITLTVQLVDRLFMGEMVQLVLNCPELGCTLNSQMATRAANVASGFVKAHIRLTDLVALDAI